MGKAIVGDVPVEVVETVQRQLLFMHATGRYGRVRLWLGVYLARRGTVHTDAATGTVEPGDVWAIEANDRVMAKVRVFPNDPTLSTIPSPSSSFPAPVLARSLVDAAATRTAEQAKSVEMWNLGTHRPATADV